MADRSKRLQPSDLELKPSNGLGSFDSYTAEAQYEIAYQLARIADALEGIRERTT